MNDRVSGRVLLSPSVMCADMCHLEEEVHRLEAAGADLLHLDIMDAHFVPNMSLGLVACEQLRPKTKLFFDMHLMVENNEFFIEQAARIGADWVSVHAESAVHLERLLTTIQEHGMKAGAALNPATPLSALQGVLHRLDCVLLMAVNPGFAGQQMASSAIKKIGDCRSMLDQHNLNIPIQVDGNVSFEKIPKIVAAGGDVLVLGSSSLFSEAGSLMENAARVREAIAEGIVQRGACS